MVINVAHLTPLLFSFSQSVDEEVSVSASSLPLSQDSEIACDVIDRLDGSYVIRYRPHGSVSGVMVNVTVGGDHVAESPYVIQGEYMSRVVLSVDLG